MPDTPEHHQQRSEFIRRLVQHGGESPPNERYRQSLPKTIIQFWHDVRELPADVEECIASWTRWTKDGFVHRLFDERSAKTFIHGSLGARHERAFKHCYHPAMKADYFRMCYLFIEGGFYVDADDVCIGEHIHGMFDDGRLKVQPLCYDIASDTMVNQAELLRPGASDLGRIFYFNNNPLIAARGHPIIERALRQATELLERADEVPEIQTTTGPGNLSKSIFEAGTMSGNMEGALVILRNWDSIAVSKWPLSYRADARNWRLSNQQRFQGGGEVSA